VTGFGGTVWLSGRIFAVKKPTRASKSPTFLVDVIYGGTATKTHGMKLSFKTYGPAQCKVDNVRFGGENHADSYTAGWVFLVAADADDEPAVPGAALPPQ
jgi:hypothetical protein